MTVIGWIWLVLAGLLLLRSIVDLVIWKALQPAAPTLLGELEKRDPQIHLLRPMFRYFTAIKLGQTALAAAVIFFAYAFLRLRPWARVAIQVVCGFGIAYVVGFTTLLAVIWTRAAGHAPAGDQLVSQGKIGFVTGLGISFAVAAGLVLTIALLRGSDVREAFRRFSDG